MAIVGLFDISVFLLFMIFLRKTFNQVNAMASMKSLFIVFAVFGFSVVMQIVLQVSVTLYPTNFVRYRNALWGNILFIVFQFPCVLIICYFHHQTYKRQYTIKSRQILKGKTDSS